MRIAYLLPALTITLPQETDDEIFPKLFAATLDLDVADVSVREFVDLLRARTSLNFVIDPAVKEEGTITLRLKGVRLSTILNLSLKPLGLGVVVSEGILLVVPREKLYKQVTTRVYDVRDLFLRITDFPGPRIEISTAQGGPGIGPGTSGEGRQTFNEEVLEELIRAMTGKGTWEENPNCSIAFLANRMMVVTQTRRVHREIENLLARLGEFR